MILGFVDDDSKGWVGTIWHIDGPNENDILLTERINRFITDASPQTVAIQPTRDNNLRLTGDRDYLVTNSVNVADLSGFELNRTWLWKPLHNGGRLQPSSDFGTSGSSTSISDRRTTRYDDNGFPTPPNGIPPIDALTATTEQLTSLEAGVTNDMVGGQLGMHWDKDYRQWNFSGDVKGFAMQNFQNWNNVLNTETTIYGGELPQEDTTPDTVVHDEAGLREPRCGVRLRDGSASGSRLSDHARFVASRADSNSWTSARVSDAASTRGQQPRRDHVRRDDGYHVESLSLPTPSHRPRQHSAICLERCRNRASHDCGGPVC